MRIVSVARALPDNVYRQEDITNALKDYWGDKLEQPASLEKLHSRVGVSQRHLAFSFAEYYKLRTFGESNRAWFEVGAELGASAIDAALERAHLARHDIDALYVVSITGVASPSLDARMINRLQLRPDVKRTPIFGLGCVGGAVGLTRAADYVRAYPEQIAVLLSVELCSLTIRRDDLSTVNLIATGLFGDGALAAVVGGNRRVNGGAEIVAQRSVFYGDTEDIMGWDISEKGFGVVLSKKLPALIKSHLGADVDAFLADNGLTRRDIGSWVIHPGGPKVLQAVEEALGLYEGELRLSWQCLDRVGNLSSASVLCVLEEVMTRYRPAPGTVGLVSAMGPGFCSELILLRW